MLAAGMNMLGSEDKVRQQHTFTEEVGASRERGMKRGLQLIHRPCFLPGHSSTLRVQGLKQRRSYERGSQAGDSASCPSPAGGCVLVACLLPWACTGSSSAVSPPGMRGIRLVAETPTPRQALGQMPLPWLGKNTAGLFK